MRLLLYMRKNVVCEKEYMLVSRSRAAHVLKPEQPHIIWKIELQAHKAAENDDCHDDHPFCKPGSQCS